MHVVAREQKYIVIWNAQETDTAHVFIHFREKQDSKKTTSWFHTSYVMVSSWRWPSPREPFSTKCFAQCIPGRRKCVMFSNQITFFLKFTIHVSKILCLKWVKTQSQPCLGSLCCSCLLWFSHLQMRFVMMYKVKTISGLWLFLSVWLRSTALECTLYNPLKLKALLNCWRYASWHQVCNLCPLNKQEQALLFPNMSHWYHP